jgi:hypothetical protein
MTENTYGWGGVLAGGLVGYLAGANGGGLFGNGGCAKQCGCPNPEIAAIDAKVTDLENWNQSREILGTVTAGNEGIMATLNQINRDNYALGVQGIYNQQTVARNIDKEFCNTNGIIVADGEKTRGAIAAFQTRYLEDRIHDRDLMIAKLQNELVAAPLACGLAAVNSKLDSVIGCAGVKTCGSVCGSSNPYTIPPLVGTATNTQSYNPTIPAA